MKLIFLTNHTFEMGCSIKWLKRENATIWNNFRQ